MGPTQQLAAFVAGATYGALPEGVVHEAKRCWLDWLGVALGGSATPAVQKLLELAATLGNRGPCTVLGRSQRRLDSLWAAATNGQAGHVLDFDDTLVAPGAVLHSNSPVLPAVLALGESLRSDGRRAVLATVIGVDVAWRSALAFGQSHIDRGFHATGTAGTLGAAAASAALLGLDAERTAQALGLAASQASGLRCFHGTMTKSFQAGHAAASGLLAALLAERGFDSGSDGYESERGLARAMTDQLDAEWLVRDLGHTWLISQVGFKPYPCGVVTHPIIDAMLALRAQGLLAADVEHIDLTVHPHVLSATGKTVIRTELDAKFSVYHCAAAALVDGAVSLAQFTRERIDDPVVAALRERVVTTVTAGIARDATRVTVTRRDGRQVSLAVDHASGTEHRPLSDDQVRRKFHGLADGVLGAAAAERLAERVWSIQSLDDIGEVVRLATA